jgi:hypothetical protein
MLLRICTWIADDLSMVDSFGPPISNQQRPPPPRMVPPAGPRTERHLS